MKKLIGMLLILSACAFASGTIKPGAKTGNRCATANAEGKITTVDVERGEFALLTSKGENKSFKINNETDYRIPGVKKEELKTAPLSKVAPNSEAKVSYCSKDMEAVEIKVGK